MDPGKELELELAGFASPWEREGQAPARCFEALGEKVTGAEIVGSLRRRAWKARISAARRGWKMRGKYSLIVY